MGSKVPPKRPMGPVSGEVFKRRVIPGEWPTSGGTATGELDDQERHFIPGVSAMLALDHAIGTRDSCREPRIGQLRRSALGIFERGRRLLPAARRTWLRGAPDVADLACERPQRERGFHAFATQAGKNAQRTWHVGAERGFAELEHVEARAVANRGLHRGKIDAFAACSEPELLELLLRGEQIALGALDDEPRGIVVDVELECGRRVRAAIVASGRARPATPPATRPRIRMLSPRRTRSVRAPACR